MNREDIIRMAREAGCVNCDCCLPEPEPHEMQEFIERFAALVAAAEREACAKVCDSEATIEGIAQRCAAAIRARGEK